MSTNEKDRVPLATTFREDEVTLMNELLKRLLMGGDARQLLKSPAFANVARKFQHMQSKLVAARDKSTWSEP